MCHFILFCRRSMPVCLMLALLLSATDQAEAQGIGFQGGATVDPEQVFVGTHFETREIFQGLRFRPGIDGGFGGDYSLASINIEFVYHTSLGRSGWSLYQGGGPAVILTRLNENTDVGAGTFFTFGFAHENGFFSEFKYGGGRSPTLKFGAGFTIRRRTP
jgi:hypothetical protein